LTATVLALFLRLFEGLPTTLQAGGPLFGNEGPIEFSLDLATGTFSFVLFALTLYAWTRRSRQPTLLFVSLGFLTFFAKQLIGVLPLGALHGELFASIMDFATLSLFFVGLVLRPRRRQAVSSRQELEDERRSNQSSC
jgi:heme A synthase